MTLTRIAPALAFALAFALASCHGDDDPCGSRTEACLAVALDGDRAQPIESLHLHLEGAGLAQTDYDLAPSGSATLPFTSVLVFDQLPVPVAFRLDVVARRTSPPWLSGSAMTAITPGEHRRVSVSLSAVAPDGGPGDCPPRMVRIPGQTFCVDAHEVTNTDYRDFLAANPTKELYPGTCHGPLFFTPDGKWPFDPGDEALPVTDVHWCNAAAYCKAAGKRLCGRIGGGTNAFADYADATRSEWFNACSAGGARSYPYGSTYDGTRCNGNDYNGQRGPRAVGSATGCEGGYPGLFDLSGNVAEWEDSCEGEDCLVRGGYWTDTQDTLRCDRRYPSRMYWGLVNIGFRCCK